MKGGSSLNGTTEIVLKDEQMNKLSHVADYSSEHRGSGEMHWRKKMQYLSSVTVLEFRAALSIG